MGEIMLNGESYSKTSTSGNNNEITAEDIGALPISGGTLTGELITKKGINVETGYLDESIIATTYDRILVAVFTWKNQPGKGGEKLEIPVTLNGLFITVEFKLYSGLLFPLIVRFEGDDMDNPIINVYIDCHRPSPHMPGSFFIRRLSETEAAYAIIYVPNERGNLKKPNIINVSSFNNPIWNVTWNWFMLPCNEELLSNMGFDDIYTGKIGNMADFWIGDGIHLYESVEGGNCSIYSPKGNMWEMDSHNDESFRIYLEEHLQNGEYSDEPKLFFPLSISKKQMLVESEYICVENTPNLNYEGCRYLVKDTVNGRNAFFGTANRTGMLYLYDQTNKKPILTSDKLGYNSFYGDALQNIVYKKIDKSNIENITTSGAAGRELGLGLNSVGGAVARFSVSPDVTFMLVCQEDGVHVRLWTSSRGWSNWKQIASGFTWG